METKEYIIKEIKKYNKTKGKIYAFMSIIPATVLASLGVIAVAAQTTDPLINSAAIITPIVSTLIDYKVMEEYKEPKTITSPYGADDWSKTKPSLEEQLIKAKANLTSLYAKLIEENKKGRG